MQHKAWNDEFAGLVAGEALGVIRRRVAKEKEQGDLNCEVYYPIGNPFGEGSEEYRYIKELLSSGSGRNPDYIDLFDKLRTAVKGGLDSDGVHSFLMLNCRFEESYEDNFLLYALVSWGG